ncbi:hypothetical protein ACRRTK_014993 [Alexandromys fortis]
MVAKGWLPFLLVALYLGIFDHPCDTQELRCLCIQLSSDFIPRNLTKYVWVILENIYCNRMEVICLFRQAYQGCRLPGQLWMQLRTLLHDRQLSTASKVGRSCKWLQTEFSWEYKLFEKNSSSPVSRIPMQRSDFPDDMPRLMIRSTWISTFSGDAKVSSQEITTARGSESMSKNLETGLMIGGGLFCADGYHFLAESSGKRADMNAVCKTQKTGKVAIHPNRSSPDWSPKQSSPHVLITGVTHHSLGAETLDSHRSP